MSIVRVARRDRRARARRRRARRGGPRESRAFGRGGSSLCLKFSLVSLRRRRRRRASHPAAASSRARRPVLARRARRRLSASRERRPSDRRPAEDAVGGGRRGDGAFARWRSRRGRTGRRGAHRVGQPNEGEALRVAQRDARERARRRRRPRRREARRRRRGVVQRPSTRGQRGARARVAHAVGGDDGGSSRTRAAPACSRRRSAAAAHECEATAPHDELRAPQVAAPPHQRRVVEEAEAAAKRARHEASNSSARRPARRAAAGARVREPHLEQVARDRCDRSRGPRAAAQREVSGGARPAASAAPKIGGWLTQPAAPAVEPPPLDRPKRGRARACAAIGVALAARAFLCQPQHRSVCLK